MKLTTKKVYTLTQASGFCQVHRTTLWRWIKDGRLPAYQTPSGQYRIKEDDLHQFIKSSLPFIDLEASPPPTRILIVDDDAAFRKLMKRYLSGDRFVLEEAVNGFQAGQKIHTFKPDFIILDLFMPTIDGFEICRQVKADSATRHIFIAVVTGRGTPETEKKTKAIGADAYLQKPIGRQSLTALIERFKN